MSEVPFHYNIGAKYFASKVLCEVFHSRQHCEIASQLESIIKCLEEKHLISECLER